MRDDHLPLTQPVEPAEPSEPEYMDFCELTCTNLMIKVKILTKKLVSGQGLIQGLHFLTTREGHTNLEPIYTKMPWTYVWKELGPNKFAVSIKRVI